MWYIVVCLNVALSIDVMNLSQLNRWRTQHSPCHFSILSRSANPCRVPWATVDYCHFYSWFLFNRLMLYDQVRLVCAHKGFWRNDEISWWWWWRSLTWDRVPAFAWFNIDFQTDTCWLICELHSDTCWMLCELHSFLWWSQSHLLTTSSRGRSSSMYLVTLNTTCQKVEVSVLRQSEIHATLVVSVEI